MHLHILGACGTFMGGLALLAKARGHRVTGSDIQAYPPMSTLLEGAGIALWEGYDPAHLDPAPDLVLVGNALSRGNPAVEACLARDIPYASGPEWLAREVLAGRWVLAVAGTHGKTSTASMLAWILEDSGLEPGFLIGGEPLNFTGQSARLGSGPFFVVEADEYDTAFFDKRSKFIHYRPRTLVLNNLEYDHADIFPDLGAIVTQFHHLVRTVPGNGLIVRNGADPNLDAALAKGCWTPTLPFGGSGRWQIRMDAADGNRFSVLEEGRSRGQVAWSLAGAHNAWNALAAILAARHAGVPAAVSCAALGRFQGVRRRLELRGEANGVRLYDDFAHHPTAIAATIDALRGKVGQAPIIAVLEPRSNTMKLGVHRDRLGPALRGADAAYVYAPPDLPWDAHAALAGHAQVFSRLEDLESALVASLHPGDHVLIMSNGAFGGIHQRLLGALARSGEVYGPGGR